MNFAALRDRLLLQEDLNFLLTNRIPRIAATRFMGWFSRIESPLLARASIAVWRLFTDLDLADAVPQRYTSLHQCFTRALVPGARSFDADPQVLTSPCDAIVGAFGTVHDGQVLQAKGYPYRLDELLGDAAEAARYRDGSYVTLRLTSAMYHRFHAPHDATVEQVHYIAGDTWNVNPIALARVERLFCKNERAPIRLRLEPRGVPVTLVAVAAVLVASIRLHGLPERLHLGYRGPQRIAVQRRVAKGDELGWFEHGSTVIVFAPAGCVPAPGIEGGACIRAGQALLRLPSSP